MVASPDVMPYLPSTSFDSAASSFAGHLADKDDNADKSLLECSHPAAKTMHLGTGSASGISWMILARLMTANRCKLHFHACSNVKNI